ncbi:hypothetical protein T484DRAFT_1863155 [Baffinella frigidus]|nr:hypothetical protein T484DRAFT_1863155 [Cryptophyta sp. CCMP2293]
MSHKPGAITWDVSQVPENLTEPFRVRNFTILYFLVDDSIQINEHRQMDISVRNLNGNFTILYFLVDDSI